MREPVVFNVLKDIRVLDFGKFVAAPLSTWLLSNMGAEVIKIEPPGGAPDREPFRMSDTLDGAGFVQLHSNKMSLCLDHVAPQGRGVLEKLLAQTDVIVLGAPDSTLARQGLDYDSISKINPAIIYLNVSAFTSVGPRANEVGFDGVGQAMSGAAYMSGFGDTPTRSFCSFVDVSTGVFSAFAIACALMSRAQTGKGHKIETALMMSAYAAMSWLLVEQAVTRRNRTRSGNRAQSSGPSDIFRTCDGWIVVQIVGDGLFARVAKVIGHPELIEDPRFKTDNDRAEHGALLSDAVNAWCCSLTTAEALEALRAARIPGSPVNSLQEALDEPQVAALQFIQQMSHPGLTGALPLFKAPVMVDGALAALRSRPPLAGEHTDFILRRAGYSPQAIDALRQAKVV
jgi:crotonobetainyl-CoA:carnitine CoA-transferase CaiB-like acyl-CoA transferase